MKRFWKNNKYFIIAFGVILIFAIYYVVMLRMSVNHYIVEFEDKYGVKEQTETEGVDLYRVPGYHELLKEQGMLDGLIRLAKSDSVNLFLNLPEKSAQLMIKGVAVRNVPLQEMTTDALFRRATDEALYNWLSEPLQIVGGMATIDKEPVTVVIAPKDTSDEVPEVVPDTLQKEPVFFILETNRDLRLYFYQTDPGERGEVYDFNRRYRYREAREALKAILSFKAPEYTPTLFIGLSKEDAQVIYRALPQQGQIVITL